MQKILCVNVSNNPAVATLVELNQSTIAVIEQHSADLGDLFKISTETVAGSNEPPGPDDPADNQELIQQAAFRELINRFEESWTGSLLVISGSEYISMDLKLPFSNPREIGKIIELEVQDQVPFEVNEFVIDHSIVEQASAGGLNNIHVGLLPRTYLRRIMRTCKACDFDPVIVTTPASILAALPHLLPDYFTADCGILYLTDDACYSCMLFDGRVKSDRVFSNNWLAARENQELYQELLREFKIYLAALENRFGRNVEKIYVIQSSLPRSVLQGALGRDVILLDTTDIIVGTNLAAVVLTCAASIFVRDNNPVRPLSNFRTQEFAFRPQLKNLYQGARSLTKFLLLAASLFALLIIGQIVINSYQVHTIRNSIASQIEQLAPELDPQQYDSIAAVNEITSKLEAELTTLGSPSRYSALDILSQLTRDLRKISGLEITQLRIAGNRVLLGGNAESYAQADELRAIFRRRHDMFCNVSRDTSATSGGARAFQYSLELCG